MAKSEDDVARRFDSPDRMEIYSTIHNLEKGPASLRGQPWYPEKDRVENRDED